MGPIEGRREVWVPGPWDFLILTEQKIKKEETKPTPPALLGRLAFFLTHMLFSNLKSPKDPGPGPIEGRREVWVMGPWDFLILSEQKIIKRIQKLNVQLLFSMLSRFWKCQRTFG